MDSTKDNTWVDPRPKTHPMRAKFRKQKADELRAMRMVERVIGPRLAFIEDTVVEMVSNGKMTRDEAINLIEKEYLAFGIDPDVSAVWQAL